MIGVGVLLLLTQIVSATDIVNHEDKGPTLLKVTGTDFENTLVDKICLLAQINATISLTHERHGATTEHVPQDVTTDGSFCNKNYVSRLQLNFGGSEIQMIFKRNDLSDHELNKMLSYCDTCNYGQWKLENIILSLLHNGRIYKGNVTLDDLKEHASWLTDGIGLKRSFKCDKKDATIDIPFHVNNILNSSNHHPIHEDGWNARIDFEMLRLQPFLVFHKGTHVVPFSDPYLCRDLTLSHVMIILVPLLWFVIFVAFHRIKHRWGCPPDFSENEKKRRESSTTNHMEISDGFEGLHMHIGPESSTCNYA